MEIVSLKTIDMETMQVVECISYSYDGPVDYCKGEAKQQMQIENQQMQLQNSLQQQQLGMQQGQINQVNPTLRAMIANGGLTPQALAALQANTINQLPQQYNQLYGNLSNQLVQRGITGGDNAGSGDIARNFGALGAQEAGQAQQGQFNIANLQQQGLMGALQTSLGVGGQYGQNIGTFGSGANSAGSSATSAAETANQSSFGNIFGSIFGGLTSMVKPR